MYSGVVRGTRLDKLRTLIEFNFLYKNLKVFSRKKYHQWERFLKNIKFLLVTGGGRGVGDYCFSSRMYAICSNNALHSVNLSFTMFIFTPLDTWDQILVWWLCVLIIPECQGTPCLKQAWNLNFKWLQHESNPQPLSS